MFTVDYGKTRIFHTTLGHAGNSLDDNIAMQCAGFQVTLLRGAEWAATGQVHNQFRIIFQPRQPYLYVRTISKIYNMQIAPNSILGKSHGHTAPSDKLNIAVVGMAVWESPISSMFLRQKTSLLFVMWTGNMQSRSWTVFRELGNIKIFAGCLMRWIGISKRL